MQTINNRMTETQIADLFSLAVQLQVKAEESDDRDTAIFAYSIQNACSNLTESQREFRAADATIHNLELKVAQVVAENAGLKDICDDRREFIMNGVQLGYIKVPTVETDPALETIRIAVSPQEPTPSTDAFLAEVRAQGVDAAIEHLNKKFEGTGHIGVPVMALEWLAQELRKGAAL
ncbi:eae-like domain protein [Salmonella enterica]|uniref:eae-like domain protein n=1 Tax=Salmonella TaxID=590 RepID=UPI002237CE89|nr:eae-like domain protein [Salmonella enterica]MCW6838083.1 eae-like domain protein [Salmonella enterica subsp. arizonae]MCW6842286.1 eae-like domain protein [Salmonella enterica subsp. enterica serovar Reading]MCW6855987.1 eae-like domain protein [Salmonella enterica subsp. arizonae]MCW6883560.1 eae-like domain protein [Salmonella enterica subsp. arizonae]MDJ5733336.1 eae-like domain protein [Salmonella enterica]